MNEQSTLFTVDYVDTVSTSVTLTRKEITTLMSTLIRFIEAKDFDEMSSLYDKLYDAKESIDKQYLD